VFVGRKYFESTGEHKVEALNGVIGGEISALD